jgi:hypothetical protein
VFRDFQYCTIDSWNRTRRVVGKAEHRLEGVDACSATRRMAGQRHPDGRSLRAIRMA